jgi:hypothetical protein
MTPKIYSFDIITKFEHCRTLGNGSRMPAAPEVADKVAHTRHIGNWSWKVAHTASPFVILFPPVRSPYSSRARAASHFLCDGRGEYLPFMPTSIHIRPNEMPLAVKRRAAVVCAENRRPNKNRISVRESVGTDQS